MMSVIGHFFHKNNRKKHRERKKERSCGVYGLSSLSSRVNSYYNLLLITLQLFR